MAVAHRIYAEALLEAARDAREIDRVRDEFAAFVAAIGTSPDLAQLLRNPQVEPVSKRDALGEMLTGAADIFRNFVMLVAEKGRSGELDEIYAEWERLLAAEDRVIEVELTTAVELTDAEADAIVKQIADATGRRVEATRSVDPDLIGGLVLQAGSLRLDGSVRSRLNGLREELLAAS
jgi:F-type H+-transporting ATPase subunit delta